MGKNRILFGGLIAIVGGVTAATSYLAPAAAEEPLVEGYIEEAVSLAPQQTIQQSFRSNGQALVGIILAAPHSSSTAPLLKVSLYDESGQNLSRSISVRQIVRDNRTFYVVRLFPRWLSEGSVYQLKITNFARAPAQLMAFPNNPHPIGSENADIKIDALYRTVSHEARTLSVLAGTLLVVSVGFLGSLKGPRLILWLVLMALIPVVLSGYWLTQDTLGISDWDYYFSVHHIIRETIVTWHQFPLWNPATCGGTAALADPEFTGLSPLFLFELVFGVPSGLRFSLLAAVGIGCAGMMMLARQIGLTALSSLLAGVTVFFSSAVILRLTEGHISVFSYVWIPWIFWAWIHQLRSARSSNILSAGTSRWTIAAGAFMSLMFYQAGIHPLMYVAGTLAAASFFTHRKKYALTVTVAAGVWAAAFAAVKLIPSLDWLSQFPDQAYASSAFSLPYWYELLLGRHLHGASVIPKQGSGWHEYGSYVGPVVLALAALALTRMRRNRTIKLLLIGTIAAILLSSAGPLLQPLFDYMPYAPRSNISRFIIMALIPLALLAGFGLDQVRRWRPAAFWLPVFIAGAAIVDILSLAGPISAQAFIVPDVINPPQQSAWPITFTEATDKIRIQSVDHDRAYVSARAGYGTMSYCSVLSPNPGVRRGTVPYVSSDPPASSVNIISWSPNVVRLLAVLERPGTITINTNYAQGWLVNGAPASNIAGRVGQRIIEPGRYELWFSYHPPGLLSGGLISAAALVGALACVRIQRRLHKQ